MTTTSDKPDMILKKLNTNCIRLARLRALLFLKKFFLVFL